MRRFFIYILFLSISVRFTPYLAAQQENEIHILCRDFGDSIALRWAPNNWALLHQAIAAGYLLERTVYHTGGDSTYTQIQLARPTRVRLENRSDQDQIHALLFEENDPENDRSIFGNIRSSEQVNMRLGLVLFSADLDFTLAKALSLGWKEPSPGPATVIKYRISVPSVGASATIYHASGSQQELTPIEDFFAIPENHQLVLNWDIFHDHSGYVAFHIERSRDGRLWGRINAQPIAVVEQRVLSNREVLTYRDSISENYSDRYYRLQGIDAFGERGPYSPVLRAQAQPRLRINSPFIYDARTSSNQTIVLHWQLAGEDSSRIKKQWIKRARHPDSTFVIIDSVAGNLRRYRDTSAQYHNYYLIQAADDLGRIYTGSIAYGELPDPNPPEAPKGLRATSDSVGVVNITWASNTEKDLVGYRVFYKRHPADEAIQLTTSIIRDTFFRDEIHLQTLNPKVYYLVKAEDQVGNRSAFSRPFRLALPDTMAPSQGTIVKIISDPEGCLLDFLTSGSDDLETHQLLKRRIGQNEWKPVIDQIETLHGQRQVFKDTMLEIGEEAEYQILAIDSSGNQSKSNIATGRRIDNKIRPAPIHPQLTWNRKLGTYECSWQYPAEFPIRKVRLFRATTTEGKFRTHKYLDPEPLVEKRTDELIHFRYVIPNLEKNHEYLYKIKLELMDRLVSKMGSF